MLARDHQRFTETRARVNVLPLGSGALAGSGFPFDREAMARDLGFDDVGAGQHFLSRPYQMLQLVPLLARIAAEAGDLRVCSGIPLLTLLNPVAVAENAATLNAFTGGRFVFGFGLGTRQE